MSSAAPAAVSADEPIAAPPKKSKPGLTRRSGLYLLAGLLIVAGIPVVATVRILDANALRNQKAHADAELIGQLQSAGDELRGVSDDASIRAANVTSSKVLQRALLTHDRATISRFAHTHPNTLIYVGRARVAGKLPPVSLTRSVSFVLNGKRVGGVTA